MEQSNNGNGQITTQELNWLKTGISFIVTTTIPIFLGLYIEYKSGLF